MIRPAVLEDCPAIRKIYAAARAYMRTHGNPSQWGDTSPREELWQGDIRLGRLYVAEDAGQLYGVFALVPGEDPTYRKIEGAWRDGSPYATLHRVASDGTHTGVFAQCLAFSKKKYTHLRIDTHKDNLPMRHLVQNYGFAYCGIIYVQDGSPRLAYEYSSPEKP